MKCWAQFRLLDPFHSVSISPRSYNPDPDPIGGKYLQQMTGCRTLPAGRENGWPVCRQLTKYKMQRATFPPINYLSLAGLPRIPLGLPNQLRLFFYPLILGRVRNTKNNKRPKTYIIARINASRQLLRSSQWETGTLLLF